jgi:phosphorylcholine metabolism protein LicD
LAIGFQIPAQTHYALYALFEKVHKIFTLKKWVYTALYGTLLGVIREKAIIFCDDDIDLGYRKEDKEAILSFNWGQFDLIAREFPRTKFENIIYVSYKDQIIDDTELNPFPTIELF